MPMHWNKPHLWLGKGSPFGKQWFRKFYWEDDKGAKMERRTRWATLIGLALGYLFYAVFIDGRGSVKVAVNYQEILTQEVEDVYDFGRVLKTYLEARKTGKSLEEVAEKVFTVRRVSIFCWEKLLKYLLFCRLIWLILTTSILTLIHFWAVTLLGHSLIIILTSPSNRSSFSIETIGENFRLKRKTKISWSRSHLDSYRLISRPIKNGDVIFLKADDVELFSTEILPKIKTKFILITHNSDWSRPTQPKSTAMLDDPRLIRWFAQNVAFHHPKLASIPIGLENRFWGNSGDIEIMEPLLKKPVPMYDSDLRNTDRSISVYVNFGPSHHELRPVALKSFEDVGYKEKERIDRITFWERIKDSKFVLSPPGKKKIKFCLSQNFLKYFFFFFRKWRRLS